LQSRRTGRPAGANRRISRERRLLLALPL